MISIEEINELAINVNLIFDAFERVEEEYEAARRDPSTPVNYFNEIIVQKFNLLHEKMDLLSQEDKELLVEKFFYCASKARNTDTKIAYYCEAASLSIRMKSGRIK